MGQPGQGSLRPRICARLHPRLGRGQRFEAGSRKAPSDHMTESRALVLFSGGQDSTTCLAWALDRYDLVETIGFRYGQRHAVELEQRPVILAALPKFRGRLGMDHLVDLTATLAGLGETALTQDIAIAMQANGLPNTFVPGRNLFFLTAAAAIAYRRGIGVLVGGMCETDYSGYPDCRNDTIQSMAETLSRGLDYRIAIETPLMWLDKAATWAMADDLGGDQLVRLIVDDTHSCYLGDRTHIHPWGRGCGVCPACVLRAEGWRRWCE